MTFAKMFLNGKIALGAVLATGMLWGQGQQQPTVMMERQISLALATEAAQAAVDKCRADGFRVTVTVLDRAGNLKALLRDDTTSPHTVETSRRKALTSIFFRITSGEFVQRLDANPGLRSVDGTMPLAGGLPIRSGNEVIGAIGVGGAPGGDRDEACAQAGIDKIANRL